MGRQKGISFGNRETAMMMRCLLKARRHALLLVLLLLLGSSGGPDSVGMTPGLYMYRVAFLDGKFGYACALGMVLFALILMITVIYQKYVKVDK